MADAAVPLQANPNSEEIWLAAVKLESENNAAPWRPGLSGASGRARRPATRLVTGAAPGRASAAALGGRRGWFFWDPLTEAITIRYCSPASSLWNVKRTRCPDTSLKATLWMKAQQDRKSVV